MNERCASDVCMLSNLSGTIGTIFMQTHKGHMSDVGAIMNRVCNNWCSLFGESDA
jgi:hypothetical protein